MRADEEKTIFGSCGGRETGRTGFLPREIEGKNRTVQRRVTAAYERAESRKKKLYKRTVLPFEKLQSKKRSEQNKVTIIVLTLYNLNIVR